MIRYVVADPALDVGGIIDLFVDVGWGDHSQYDVARVRQMFSSMTFYAIAYHEDEVVGLVRAFSDRVHVTWISELVTKSNFQKRGIGRNLMNFVFEEFGETSIYLEALSGTEDFFDKVGVGQRPNKLIACSRAPNSVRQRRKAWASDIIFGNSLSY